MTKLFFISLLLIFSGRQIHAQEIGEVPLKTIADYIDGYNMRDYQKMRDKLSPILKVFFSKKKLKQAYGGLFELMGEAKIDNITKRSEIGYLINLKYARDTTEVMEMKLSISEKGKIVGLGSASNQLLYPKRPDGPSLSEKVQRGKIDSMAVLKHKVASFNGSVLVLKDKKVFYQKSFGFSDMENKTELDENSLSDLASVSKQFTAMAIMMLKKEALLSYSQTVQDFFPDFPYKNITIQNLLNHTSGLPDYMVLFEEKWDKTKIAENSDVMAYLKKYKPKTRFKPGQDYDYSNTGYVVLGSIIEKVSGMSYAQFMRERIFEPLEMNHSKVYNTKYSKNEVVENYAKGYTFDTKSQKYVRVSEVAELDFYRYLDGITGDGAVNSTTSDLVKWDNALREYKLVDEVEFKAAIQSVDLGSEVSEYGFGWELQTNDDYQKLIYHSGNWAGNVNFILHFLEKDLTVVILSNNEYFNVQLFADKIAKIMNE